MDMIVADHALAVGLVDTGLAVSQCQTCRSMSKAPVASSTS